MKTVVKTLIFSLQFNMSSNNDWYENFDWARDPVLVKELLPVRCSSPNPTRYLGLSARTLGHGNEKSNKNIFKVFKNPSKRVLGARISGYFGCGCQHDDYLNRSCFLWKYTRRYSLLDPLMYASRSSDCFKHLTTAGCIVVSVLWQVIWRHVSPDIDGACLSHSTATSH